MFTQYGTDEQIKYIKTRLNKFEVSAKLKKVLEDKTIAIAIKHYSYNKKNSDINFQRRQTRNLNKIYKLINVINNKYKSYHT